MIITIHRGINQIGGCITEIESESGTKIIIDFGHNLPDGDQPSKDEFANNNAANALFKGVSAVFYTHNHGDHVELFEYVPDGVSQFIGRLARKVMLAKLEHMQNVDELKKECEDKIDKLKKFGEYVPGKGISVNDDIVVTPFLVSHSATDSYMLLVTCDGKTMIHTGDFREHGYMGTRIFDSIIDNHLAGNVDVLVTEGTNIGQDDKKVVPEECLKEEFDILMGQYKNVFILSSSADADRLESIYSAHRKHKNKPLIVDAYQKQVMSVISEHWKGIGKYYHFNLKYIYDFRESNHKMIEWMKKEGFVMMIRRSEKFQGFLDYLLPFCDLKETCLIYSQYRGYIIPGKGGYNPEAKQFVDQFPPYKYCHTSGHASKETLVKLCELISPKSAIIPIHKDSSADMTSILRESKVLNKIRENTCEIDGIQIVIKRELIKE